MRDQGRDRQITVKMEVGAGATTATPARDPFPIQHQALAESDQAFVPTLEGRAGPLAVKRMLDIVCAGVGLLLLSPLLALIAIAIKLDSPGPVFFRQRRIGQGNDAFGMLKFRTMFDGADDQKDNFRHLNEAASGLFKINGDPRTTRFGALLRSTSLDELPQLWHVLTGEMSLVGPRPLIVEEDAQINGYGRCRCEMRPGMTGPWQVAGASRVPIEEMIELDRDYVETWTVGGDLRLIFRTIPHVLLRRGV